MALYRCASCGSPNVKTDSETSGVKYNYVKGAIGTVALGVGGAAAGIESKTQEIFKCPDCGLTLSYSMPGSLKDAIDRGLVDENIRTFLFVEGFGQLSWSLIRKQYKNIEEGIADKIISERKDKQITTLLEYATATKDEFDKAVDVIVDFERRLSCNGSIYDKLPDDAFTDENPMTLEEYYIWNNSICVLIENLSNFLPEPLPEEYRGLKGYRMKQYFIAYLYEKVRLEYGRYPRITKYYYCEEFKTYAMDNPFVCFFANMYFRKTFIPFGTVDEKEIPWDPDKFAEISRERASMHCPYFIKIGYSIENSENVDLKIYVDIPRYMLKDGRLYFWRESNPHNRTADGKGTMQDYFKHNPEKSSELKNKVQNYFETIKQKTKNDTKIETLKKSLEKNSKLVGAKKSEIDILKNKIFGKKKALAQIEILEDEIKKLKDESEDLNNQIINLKEKESPLNEADFVISLIEDMDYFVVWNWVGDAKRIADEKKNKAQKILTNMEIKKMIVETLEIANKELTISEILSSNSELASSCSAVKFSALILQLLNEGRIIKKEFEGKAYFAVI